MCAGQAAALYELGLDQAAFAAAEAEGAPAQAPLAAAGLVPGARGGPATRLLLSYNPQVGRATFDLTQTVAQVACP